jgi:hypothetical protein
MIECKIFDALSIEINKKTFNIETSMVTVHDKEKYAKHSQIKASDTLEIKLCTWEDSVSFENFELEKILAFLGEEYNRVFIISEETPRINFKLKKGDWNLTEEKLEADLGLALDTKTVQEERYVLAKESVSR